MSISKTFEQIAAAYPEQTALRFQQQRITYDALNRRANKLARYIQGQGIKSGDTVACYFRRSPEAIITMLAILKCGASYLPLDTQSNKERLQFCIDAASVSLTLTDQPDLALSGCAISVVDEAHPSFDMDDSNLLLHISPDSCCYLMFTSGSTGAPKGVVVPHRAVLRLVIEPDFIAISPEDTFFLFAPLSFDASTLEIWGALLNGATLAIYSGVTLDPNLFSDEIRDHRVSVLWLTAALFHLIAARYIDVFAGIRVALAGGDVVNPDTVCALLEQYPGITVINGYGPTENTTFTCCHVMTNDNPPVDKVPVGKAISGTVLHILDDNQQPVKPGQEGELFVSGAGVALGYLNQPHSPETFFTDETIAPGLIYRTGDLVVENPRGELEFIGRKDNQVKIRGYRASLEDIQTQVTALPAVREAIVFLDKFDDGEQVLTAHVVLSTPDSLRAIDVKKQLKSRLPAWAVPDSVKLCLELPITVNGKLDRKQASTIKTNKKITKE